MTQVTPVKEKAADGPREALIHNLYTWGPALTHEIRANYPNAIVLEMVRAKIVARKKFTGFEVYLLSGMGLRPYGHSLRYNYVPAKKVVLGALIVRAMARQYEQDGYTVTLYNGYAKRGRDNLLLARKDGALTMVVGRTSLTIKALRLIVSSVQETMPELAAVHTVVIQGDHDPLLLSAQTVNNLPLKVVQLPLTRITREEFKEK